MRITRDARSLEKNLEVELNLLRRRVNTTPPPVSPPTTVVPIDHIFEVFNEYGATQAGITIDGSHFLVSIEVWTAGTMAAGTEIPVITDKGGGKYRIAYVPIHTGSLYRTLVQVKPDGVNFGIVDPKAFQDLPVISFL